MARWQLFSWLLAIISAGVVIKMKKSFPWRQSAGRVDGLSEDDETA